MHSELTISKSAFAANVRVACSLLRPGTKLCASLKGNAYGHGLRELAPVAVANGAVYIGVCTNAEVETAAESLAAQGLSAPLLRLRPALPEEAEALQAQGLPVEELVGSWQEALRLHALGEQLGRRIRVHVNLDSGMGRAGFYYKEPAAMAEMRKLVTLSGIEIVGLMTHFPCADAEDLTPTLVTFRDFMQAVQTLKQESPAYRLARVHCASSAMGLRCPEAQQDMVRFGALLYGCRTSEYVPMPSGIQPVMRWRTKVVRVADVAAGTPIGYGALYATPGRVRIATLPLGYGDGYPRQLTNKGVVLICGRRCPVVGRISLNVMTVAAPPEVEAGDEVVLLGCQGAECITAEELGAAFGSVHTEVQMAGFYNTPIFVE